MDMLILKQVKEAIPFDCKIRCKDGTIINGQITGRKLPFPMVRLPGQGSFGISWFLAARVLFDNVTILV